MFRGCAVLFFAVCALWTFGETMSCDQCGLQCADMCGTRQFRACCFNNMKKRQSDLEFGSWMKPRRYAMRVQTIYGNPDPEDVE